MAISLTFQRYLATKNVVYDIVAHAPTKSSMRTAEASRISGDRVAKAVVLRDEYGYVLAILPASHHIRLDDLRMQLGLDVELADEYESKRYSTTACAVRFLQPANAMGSIRWSTTVWRISPRFTWRAAIMRRWFT